MSDPLDWENETNESTEVVEFDENEPVEVTIKFEDEEHKIMVEPDETILDAALEADLDPPYSCRVAACSTCRAKLMRGKIEMDDREILSDEEIEEGYVLSCQSHPKSHGVYLDYDAD